MTLLITNVLSSKEIECSSHHFSTAFDLVKNVPEISASFFPSLTSLLSALAPKRSDKAPRIIDLPDPVSPVRHSYEHITIQSCFISPDQ